jgi:hypothetical protein
MKRSTTSILTTHAGSLPHLADRGFGGRSHPQIAWAKLGALVPGAPPASRSLGLEDSHA